MLILNLKITHGPDYLKTYQGCNCVLAEIERAKRNSDEQANQEADEDTHLR